MSRRTSRRTDFGSWRWPLVGDFGVMLLLAAWSPAATRAPAVHAASLAAAGAAATVKTGDLTVLR